MPYPNPSSSVEGTSFPLTGTSVDVTGIPSSAKRITIALANAATNTVSSTDNIVVQLGDSGGLETSGYIGTAFGSVVPSFSRLSARTGFLWDADLINGAGMSVQGLMLLSLMDAANFTWACICNLSPLQSGTVSSGQTAGRKSLSATLDRIRLTTELGTASFTGGFMRVIVEG